MFGISGEHIVILAIILILFGPRRLPELGNTMGKAIRNFKDALAGVEEAKFRKLDDSQNGTQTLSKAPAPQAVEAKAETISSSLAQQPVSENSSDSKKT